MTDSVSPVSSASSSPPVEATQGAGQAKSAAAAPNASTPISSVGDLQSKAPKVYDAMLMSIALNITKEMQHHQEHLKKIMDEARETQR